MPFGDTINAGLMSPDFSAIERAVQSQGAGMQAIGQGIAGALQGFGEMKKQRNEMEKTIKQSELYIDAAIKLFPSMQGSLEDTRNKIYDVNAPLKDRFAVAESVQGLLNMSMQKMQMDSEQLDAMRQRDIKLAELASKPPTTLEIPDSSGAMNQAYWDQNRGEFRPIAEAAGGFGSADPTLEPLPQELLTEADGVPQLSPEQEAAMIQAMGLADGGSGIDSSLLPQRQDVPTLGVKPPTQKETERFSEPFTIQGEGNRPLLAQRNLTTGETKILDKPPSGMSWEVTTDREGNTTVKQVAGGQSQQKHDPAAFREATKREGASYMLDEAARFMTDLESIPQGEGVIPSSVRGALSGVKSTAIGRASMRTQVFKDAIAREALADMRLSSPTGGALGSVSNRDIGLLENSLGSLDLTLPPEEIKQKTTRFIRDYVNVIYGTDDQISKAVEDGKITPASAAEAKILREEAFRKTIEGQVTSIDEKGLMQQPSRVSTDAQSLFEKYNSLPQFSR